MRFPTVQYPRRRLQALHRVFASEGLPGILKAALRRINSPRAQSFELCQQLLCGRAGFEIGGPSPIFSRRGLLPIYPLIAHLDNSNFGKNTIWEGIISEGLNFHYDRGREPGNQYLREAVALDGIPSDSYDFVLASHVLEHIANSLRALQEWKRLMRPQGIMVLVVPHKDGTFDHRRPVTQLCHLVEDFDRSVGEDDLTHLPEILRLHDLEKDLPAGSLDEFKKRSENNFLNRCLHHHVFDIRLLITVMDYVGLRICAVEGALPFHIIAIGQKTPSGEAPDNRAFTADGADYRRSSPFESDRV